MIPLIFGVHIDSDTREVNIMFDQLCTIVKDAYEQGKKDALVSNVVHCSDCKYNPKNPRKWADEDPVYKFEHCGHLGDNGFCSLAKVEE